MTNAELRKLQETELGILIDFDAFCKKHNLTYYLIGGALLGAVRYQKFIPWDDDIDVAMPREDYESLKRIYESSEKYFLQNSDTDPCFSRCIQKIRLHNTKAVERLSEGVPMHHGIYMDIFPIDYLENDQKWKLKFRACLIRFYLSLRPIMAGYTGVRYRRLKKAIRCLCPLRTAFIDQRLDRLCTKENSKTRKYAILWLHNYSWEHQLHGVDVFGEGSTCTFEGHPFSAPADIQAFLQRVFGENYLTEPPVEKRRNSHNFVYVEYENCQS